ncbi:MAG TPA: glycosyltransferase family 2 protein [Gemmataceae bacterium]|nr:glycosyltransferase family 2 protein [Gemmataceae bacterium]
MTTELASPPPSKPKTPQVDRILHEQPVSVLSPPDLASILIPCCGQLEFTKLCLPSLLKNTRQPFELIFLDIGSLDGTAEYLAGIATAATQVRVEIVRTPTDLGISAAVQDAIKQARGEYLVLLNNDTIVTNGWLNHLVGLAKLTPALGLVGPMSNYAAPPQLVENISYRIGPKKNSRFDGKDEATSNWLVDVSAVESFARTLSEQNRGKWVETERLGGFCLLIKREVLKRIGHLRDWTDLAIFDTDILSTKARQAGFTLACCRDLFVHHFGTRTFAHGAPKAEANTAKA